MAVSLEELREIFRDQRIWISVGQIEELDPASDSHALRVKVKLYPDEISIIARYSFDNVGPSSGIIAFPEEGDLVLVAFAEGDEQQAFVLKSLTSKIDKLPPRSLQGDIVIKARAGKKLNLSSDTRINIGKGATTQEAEPLVLGAILKNALTDIYAKIDSVLQKLIEGPIATGNLGNPAPTDPGLVESLTELKTQFDADKTKYIDTVTTNIVSQIAFTER